MNASHFTLTLPPRMDVSQASTLREEWLKTIPENSDVFLDCAAAEFISAAGLQLILALEVMQKHSGRNLFISRASDSSRKDFAQLGFPTFIEEHQHHG